MRNPNPAKISKTTTTCGGAETIVGSIDDLLIQIFVHLPLKPLFRFKSVAKQWNTIISDPRFQLLMHNQQVHNNNNRAVGLILQNYHWDFLIRFRAIFPFDDDRSSKQQPLAQIHNIPNTLRISHSCNGLLVLRNFDVFAIHDQYYVYNPTTNQKTKNLLKDGDVIKSRERDKVVGMYLAFDPSKSPHYKVVCVWLLNSHIIQYHLGVYSSETRSWDLRRSTYKTNTTDYVDFHNGVYWNGAINWIGVYFNPDHHEMPREMPAFPDHGYQGSYFLEESCDHLHFNVFDDSHFYVYEMRRDYSEWFLKYKVDNYSHNWRTGYRVQKLFSVVRGNKDEDSFLVLGNDWGQIIRYNLVHHTCQTIHDKDYHFTSPYKASSFQYIESPCSV